MMRSEKISSMLESKKSPRINRKRNRDNYDNDSIKKIRSSTYIKPVGTLGINLLDLYNPEAYSAFIFEKLTYNLDTLKTLLPIDKLHSNINSSDSKKYIDTLKIELKNGDQTFRAKVSTNIHEIILSTITNVLRPHIYQIIDMIGREMEQFGRFIISGGEAFNVNVDPKHRKITPDIDTKFVLFYGIDVSSITENQFQTLYMKAREHLWYIALENVLTILNSQEYYTHLYENVLKFLEMCPEFSLLNVTFLKPDNLTTNKIFRKRITLLPKNTDPDEMFFFDVFLFAIDMQLEKYYYVNTYFDKDSHRILYSAELDEKNGEYVTGLLDMPIMRPGEFGFEIRDPLMHVNIAVTTNVPDTKYLSSSLAASLVIPSEKLPNFRGSFLYASRKYLIKDIDKLLALGLREHKRDKDEYRKLILQTDTYRPFIYPLPSVKPYIPFVLLKNIPNIADIVYKDNINPLITQKCLKYIAPPTINEQTGNFVGTNCNLSEEYYMEMATGEKFNYVTQKWMDCCNTKISSDRCCDRISNRFLYRINSKYISLNMANSDKTQEEKKIIKCILKSLIQFLRKQRKLLDKIELKNDEILRIKNDLGKFLYDFDSEVAYCTPISLIISNILMFAESLRFSNDDFLNDGRIICNELLQLYSLCIYHDNIGVQNKKDCLEMYNKLETNRVVRSLIDIHHHPKKSISKEKCKQIESKYTKNQLLSLNRKELQKLCKNMCANPCNDTSAVIIERLLKFSSY